jgi:phospholipid/cholesterol/gamma-HCH transport system substrate-binding protein
MMSGTASSIRRPRLAAAAGIVLALVALALILFGGGASYTLHARFASASGLVDGGLVEVAGRKVGSITDVGLAPDGEAEITMSIGDQAILPLHAGTRATIRALGQAGITNHFVDLAPGALSASTLSSGATLPVAQTSSMVNYDALLDSFGPAQRDHVDELIANSAQVFAGSGSHSFNSMLGRLDPALAEVDGVTHELAQDRAAIENVISAGSRAAGAIASRSADLQSAVSYSATALGALASQRSALADLLSRAPAVLGQAQTTLAHAGTALTTLRPALRDVVPAAPPLRDFLGQVTTVLPLATPVVGKLVAQLPNLDSSLTGLAPLRRIAVPALQSAAKALEVARPILRAARFYGSDFVLGILGGLVGAGAYNYSRWGHYERLDFIQPPQTAIGGIGAGLLPSRPLVPGIIDIKTRQLRRCPGGNVPPAVDGSTPWIPDKSLCDPSQDIPASVNVP